MLLKTAFISNGQLHPYVHAQRDDVSTISLLNLSHLQQICSRRLWNRLVKSIKYPQTQEYNYLRELKTLWQKEKLLVLRNFCLCHNVFKSRLLQIRKLKKNRRASAWPIAKMKCKKWYILRTYPVSGWRRSVQVFETVTSSTKSDRISVASMNI